MAQFGKLQVLSRMEEIALIPVFYHKDIETAKEVVAACSRGGAKVVEFTNRGDFAFQVFGELVHYFQERDPSLILGAGSIVDPYTAALFINSGANFIVGPLFNPEIAKICNRRHIPYSPGCGTASEISLAEEYGVDIVKIFPGEEVGGPKFVKSILAPCPWVKMMPTGGVEPTEESISAWINAGVVCMGIGSKLLTKELIVKKDWHGIEEKVRYTLELIRKAKTGRK
ncbi:MAG: bifunctional 4-hydroxy-2-oxoglutarate aldolase/2-dehydro-3-deoxy-phosphogluconate aldolase [Spirochaetota bacterium]